MILADFITVFADFIILGFPMPFMFILALQASLLTLGRVQASLTLLLLTRSLHPGSNRLSRLALESITEGVVTSVATLQSQLLDSDGTLSSNSLAIETDKMVDSQIVDIGIVVHALSREIPAEIESICTNSLGKLEKRKVVL